MWSAGLPDSEVELAGQDLAFFTFSAAGRVPDGTEPPRDLAGLLAGGWLVADPIVYEDFLPRSAAGIFASNLSDRGSMDAAQGEAPRDAAWLSEAIGRRIHVPEQLYAEQRAESLARVVADLGLAGDVVMSGEHVGLPVPDGTR